MHVHHFLYLLLCLLPVCTSCTYFLCLLPVPTSCAYFLCVLPVPTSCVYFLCLLPVPTSCLFQENGKVDFSVPAEEYSRILRYRFDPFCVSSSIKIFAEVEEKGRGTKFNHTASVPLVASLVRFSFDEAMPRMFRPGMEYPVMVSGFVSPCFVYAYVRTYILYTYMSYTNYITSTYVRRLASQQKHTARYTHMYMQTCLAVCLMCVHTYV